MTGDKKRTDQLMLEWINILHFYSPPFDDTDTIKRVLDQCCIPACRILLERPEAKSIININGCFLEMIDRQSAKGKEFFDILNMLVSRGQIMLTGTGKYHPIIPLIPEKEVKRQLTLQEVSLNSCLTLENNPEILFLPEMAYLPEQMEIFRKNGYKWVVIDELSLKHRDRDIWEHHLREKYSGVDLLVRNRRISDALNNSIWKKYDINSSEDFLREADRETGGNGFLVTVTDIKSSALDRKDRLTLMAEIYDNPGVKSSSVTDIAGRYDTLNVETVPASLSTSLKDMSDNIYYPLWYNPRNSLHRLLWLLLDITLEEVRAHGSESLNNTLDKMLNSSPFFWSSRIPWWDGTAVEKITDNMVCLLEKTGKGSSEKLLWSAYSIRKKIHEEVYTINRSGRTKESGKDFLREHGIGEDIINNCIR